MLAGRSDLEADAAGTMSRRVVRARPKVAERNLLARRVETVDWRRRLDADAEHSAALDGVLVEKQIVAVKRDRHVERTLGDADSRDVINVRVRQKDVPNGELLPIGVRQELADAVSRIDDHRVARLFAGDDEPVLHERPGRLHLD